MKKLFIILAMVVLVSSLILGGCAQPAPSTTAGTKTVKVGAIYGLTGPGSMREIPEKEVMKICVDWLNQKGGVTIKGEKYQIELLVEDGKWDPPGWADAATKLVYDNKVNFVIGGVVPVLIEGAQSVTEENKVILVGIRGAYAYPDKPYTFLANYPFTSSIGPIYDVLREKYPSVKVIGYMCEDEPGSRIISGASQKVAKERGYEVLVPAEIHPFEKSEYYPEWTKLISLHPDAVDQGLKMPQNTANSQKQARELGYKGPIFAPVPGNPDLILKMIGSKELATDFIHASYNAYDTKNTPPMVQEILKMWESSGQKDPFDGSTTQSWDAMWCLVQAMEKAQSLDPTAVKKAWESMDKFETTRGPAKMGGAKTFGINHIVCGPAPIIRYMNGEIEFIKWHDSWMP